MTLNRSLICFSSPSMEMAIVRSLKVVDRLISDSPPLRSLMLPAIEPWLTNRHTWLRWQYVLEITPLGIHAWNSPGWNTLKPHNLGCIHQHSVQEQLQNIAVAAIYRVWSAFEGFDAGQTFIYRHIWLKPGGSSIVIRSKMFSHNCPSAPQSPPCWVSATEGGEKVSPPERKSS